MERHGDVDTPTTDANVISSPARKSKSLSASTDDDEGKEDGTSDKLGDEGIGSFVPTQIWIDEVRSELPLATVLRLLKHLTPQVEDLSASGAAHGLTGILTSGGLEEKQVLEFIKETTMVGLLPVPHPILIRKYQPNKYTSLWFSAFMWGVIFMHNQRVPLFNGKKVKLFLVQTR